ncbi:ribose-phosphate diphosphokinase [Mycoplasma sp. SG1]|uniref:ribose-phosphate diphosphokinase n=1 Tax=Mycoplasma sp. SG1 TaxID=2810348 RepID=UPI002023F920|nr:ribose-phosphate diphosphokinase [Mycoplasma sp. SG1]URM52818.1 ribose-phosphate diphosphokinase [Mycoplasma sp. SG1]
MNSTNNQKKDDVIIFGLSKGYEIAKKVALKTNLKLGEVEVRHFLDQEMIVRILSSVRDKRVFLIQSTSTPVNDSLMELLIAIDSLKRASAKRIYVVMPYFGYARQDRKVHGREPITAKLVADLLTSIGCHRITTFDLHSSQIQGFFNIPVDDLHAVTEIYKYLATNIFNKYPKKDCIIVSPDQGGIARARQLATAADLEIAIIDKRRPKPNVAEVMNILGNVKDKICIMIDDIIDSGGTIIRGCDKLNQFGAKKIYVIATHAVFSGDACKNLNQCDSIEEVIVSDSIPLSKEKHFPKLHIISLVNFLSDIIAANVYGDSISKVYQKHTTL